MTTVATRRSWKTEPLPSARATLPYARQFSSEEFERVRRGLIPAQMEDKWFIFYEEPWLYLHRSWTGSAIFGVKMSTDGTGATVAEAWANRDAEQYRATDDSYDAAFLAFLIDRLLLGLASAFPLRPDLDPTMAPILLHHVVGYGRPNDGAAGVVTMKPGFDLNRFKVAQDRGGSFTSALAELRAGQKKTHWIWWVFPQVAGLGSSAISVRYALAGREEAHAYLLDDVLRARLVTAVTAVHEQVKGPRKPRIDRVMGSEIDVLKLVSSLTLFAEVGNDGAVGQLSAVGKLQKMAEEILAAARGAGYPACEHTLRVLAPREYGRP